MDITMFPPKKLDRILRIQYTESISLSRTLLCGGFYWQIWAKHPSTDLEKQQKENKKPATRRVFCDLLFFTLHL